MDPSTNNGNKSAVKNSGHKHVFSSEKGKSFSSVGKDYFSVLGLEGHLIE